MTISERDKMIEEVWSEKETWYNTSGDNDIDRIVFHPDVIKLHKEKDPYCFCLTNKLRGLKGMTMNDQPMKITKDNFLQLWKIYFSYVDHLTEDQKNDVRNYGSRDNYWCCSSYSIGLGFCITTDDFILRFIFPIPDGK